MNKAFRMFRGKKGQPEPENGTATEVSTPARKVFIGLPAYGGTRCVAAESSLLMAQQVLWMNRINHEFHWETKCPYVSMARNNLTSLFMSQPEFTEIVQLDADVGYRPEAFAGLLNCDVDVVAGVYPKKTEDRNDWPIVLQTTIDGCPIDKNGLLLGSGLPAGFLKIKRHVIEKMCAAYPELRYLDSNTGRFTYDLFGCGVRDYDPVKKIGRWYGDDFGFCDLWRRIGGEVWAAPNINFDHVGQKTYRGNYYNYLMSLPKIDEATPIVKALSIDGWMSPTELIWLHQTARSMSNVAEIGSFKGRGTTALLAGCPGKVTAIDHWQGDQAASVINNLLELEDCYKIFMQNVGDNPNLEVMKMSSLEAVQQVNGEGFDMVFIDGEHTYENTKADIQAWLPKTRKVICGHDYSEKWPGVIQAVQEIFGEVKVTDSIWYKELYKEASNAHCSN
jgi:precorrin-6B methylase 2